jgi:hypothetical protein
MMRLKFVLAGLLISGTAFADDQPADPNAPPPGDGTGGGGEMGTEANTGGGEAAPAVEGATAAPANSVMIAAAGKIVIAGSTANVNLSADAVAKPIFFSPAVYYGVSEKINVGLTHDGGSTPITPRPGLRFISITIPNPIDPTMTTTVTGAGGSGICISGEENGCSKVYDNVGADVLFSLSEGKNSLAAHGGLDVFSFDPFVLSLRAGVIGSYAANDKIKIVYDPRISIGITERDFNKESIDVPVWAWYAVNEKMGAYLHTGIGGPLDGFGDAFRVPVGLGLNYGVNEKLTVGGDFHFANLLGKGGDADFRVLGIRAIYAL